MSNNPTWLNKLPQAVKQSLCRSDVLRYLGLNTNGSGNHKTVQLWIERTNLDTSHFDFRKAQGRRLTGRHRVSDEQIFVVGKNNSNAVRMRAKKRLVYECELCYNKGIHRGILLSLQLDHKNGNRFDNRIENLRWLCPNCHTQTPTYGSKRLRGIKTRNPLNKYRSIDADPLWRNRDRVKTRKVVRPTKEQLLLECNSMSMVSVGKKYGVSDNAIRKWLKRYGV